VRAGDRASDMARPHISNRTHTQCKELQRTVASPNEERQRPAHRENAERSCLMQYAVCTNSYMCMYMLCMYMLLALYGFPTCMHHVVGSFDVVVARASGLAGG
jgi:hypothetical protein